jgi:hypothetical protein
MHPASPTATAVHATEASAAAVAAEAAPATAVSTAPATAAAGEGRRCQSKRGGDHTGNQIRKGPVVHLISPLLDCSGNPAAGRIRRPNSFGNFK